MLNEWKTQTDFPLSDELIKLHKLYYFFAHKHTYTVEKTSTQQNKTLAYEQKQQQQQQKNILNE